MSPLVGRTWRILPPDLCANPWVHSLSSDVPYSFVVCAPRLLHPTFSDGQGVLPCLYEPSPTLLGPLLSAWCLHLAAYLSALTGIYSMPDNCFRSHSLDKVCPANSMSFQIGRNPIRRFYYSSFSIN